jgi:hypothetical protein
MTNFGRFLHEIQKHSLVRQEFTISGAAVDPNTYATRSRPLSFLMTLLNIRLGYWIANPQKFAGGIVKPLWWIYMFREM